MSAVGFPPETGTSGGERDGSGQLPNGGFFTQPVGAAPTAKMQLQD